MMPHHLFPSIFSGCLGLTVAHDAVVVVHVCAPPTKRDPTSDGETFSCSESPVDLPLSKAGHLIAWSGAVRANTCQALM